MIAARHWDGVALWMNSPVTVASSAVWNRLVETFVDGCHSEIVVGELCELHSHERVSFVQVADVWMDSS